MTKRCSKCRIEKSTDKFFVNKRSVDGKQHRCKECCKTYTQTATKNWRESNKDSASKSNIKAKVKLKYGLSTDEIYCMLEAQNGVCAICKRFISFDAKDKRNKPHIDHCHETGVVRGLLCLTCNTGIGMFGDSSDLLEAAKTYLSVSIGQSERLSELAPEISSQDDAIVRSYGN